MVSRLMSWLRGDDITYQRLNAPLLSTRAYGEQVIRWSADKPQWLPEDVGTYTTEGYRKAALVYACIQYLAKSAGTAPLRVYLTPPKGQLQEVPDHPLRHLLMTPNDRMSEARFLSFVTLVAATTGFVVIEKERDRLGNVIGLWPLRSDWIRPIPRSAAPPDWEYRVPGHDAVTLKAEDVIPFTYSDDPTGNPTGVGPLQVLMRQVGINNGLTDFVKTFLDRGAMPLYFAIPDNEGPMAAQWRDPEMVKAFREKFRQVRSEDTVLVSPAIKDIKPLGFDFNQLAYADLRRFTEADVCSAFGIPPILIGAQVGLEHATYSNYGEARRSFYDDTMVSLWARLDDAFTRHLLPEFEWRPQYVVQFDVSQVPALQDDDDAAHARARADWSAGLVSRHVAQREAGIEPHGEDVFLLPFSAVVVPVSGSAVTPEPDVPSDAGNEDEPVDVPGEDEGDRARMLAATALGDMADLRKVVLNRQAEALATANIRFITRDGRMYLNERAQTPEQRAATERKVATQKATIARLADVLAPKLETYFAGQKERLLAEVTSERAMGLYAEWLEDRWILFTNEDAERFESRYLKRAVENLDWADEADRLRSILAAWMGEVEAQALAQTAAMLGGPIAWGTSNPLLASLVNSLGYRIRLITEQTRKDVETVVRTALLEGTTMPDLADQLRGLFDETYANRHLAVARTESMVGYGRASTLAYQRSGVVSQVMIADNAEHVDRYAGAQDGLTCAERNRLVVPVDRGPYHVESDHPNGSACIIPIVDSL